MATGSYRPSPEPSRRGRYHEYVHAAVDRRNIHRRLRRVPSGAGMAFGALASVAMTDSATVDRARRLPLVLVMFALVAAGVVACAGEQPAGFPPSAAPVPPVGLAAVLAAVRRAPAVRTLPADLTPALAAAADDLGFDNDKCEAGPAADRIAACVFGDPASQAKVVLYGDSHAGMWLPAMTAIAERRHWRLQLYGKPACPAPRLPFFNQRQGRPFTECDRFRDYVAAQVLAERPALVVVADESFSQKTGRGALVTPRQWQTGLAGTLRTLRGSDTRVVVLGDTPVLDESAPECLAAHARDVSACSTTRAVATEQVWNDADRAAARATGSAYIPVLPWLCSAICMPVIGNVTVYRDRFHLTASYARLMSGVLEESLVKTFPPGDAP
jgi:hypothetical protein